VDCHAHVFGPFDRYPLIDSAPYIPPALPARRYLKMLDRIGISRGVLVQPVVYGTNCGALLKALKSHPKRLRGVALLSSEVTDAELMKMDRCGVRGARFSRPPPGYTAGAVGFDVLAVLAPKLVGLGWHAQIWAPCAELEPIVTRFAPLGLQLVVDHMAGIDAQRGIEDPHFQTLLRLLGNSQYNLWVKLIPYRVSRRYPDYEDVAPFHRALVAANPDRVIWGSDWPHVHMQRDIPDEGHLLDLLYDWTADDDVCRRILVDNPARLYGF
jgi:predicted TIM-barrel fold metal-dependent hydrolase